MSIINEALKKAGREKAVAAGYSLDIGVEDARRNLRFEEKRRKENLNWGPLFIVLVLLLITGPIIAPVFSIPFRHTHKMENALIPAAVATDIASARPALPAASTREAQFGIEERPLFNAVVDAQAARPPLNLSGIVYSPNGSYCILNEKIAKIGDTISGAKIIAVAKNQVTLEYHGNQIVLNVS